MSSGQVIRPGSATIHRILVVDDDAEDTKRLKAHLEDCGFAVTLAKDGGQAQASFVMHQPDLVILDLILPGESGYEVCERLKQTNDAIPVVVVSAIDFADSRSLAERVGADAYVAKPWSKVELVQTIDDVADRNWTRLHSERKRTDERVHFSCLHCGKRFKVSAAHRGKSLTCPKCGEPVHVPRHD